MEHAVALKQAVSDIHGVDLDGIRVDAAGRTDRAIARSLLEAAGMSPHAIDGRAEDVLAATCAAYEALCPPDLSATVSPGIADLLPRLAAREDRFAFSLVTGNYERVARLKLAAAGSGGSSRPARALSVRTPSTARSCRPSPGAAPGAGRGTAPS